MKSTSKQSRQDRSWGKVLVLTAMACATIVAVGAAIVDLARRDPSGVPADFAGSGGKAKGSPSSECAPEAGVLPEVSPVIPGPTPAPEAAADDREDGRDGRAPQVPALRPRVVEGATMGVREAVACLESTAGTEGFASSIAEVLGSLVAHASNGGEPRGEMLQRVRNEDTRADVRVVLLDALVGSGAAEVQAELVRFAGSDEEGDEVRRQTIEALRSLADPASETLLALERWVDEGGERGSIAAETLGYCAAAGPERERISRFLEHRLGADPDSEVALIQALGHTGAESAREVLIRVARDGDETARLTAFTSLRSYADDPLVEAALVTALVRGDSERIRATAAAEAAGCRGAGSVAALEEAARWDLDACVGRGSVEALIARMDREPAARCAVERLVELAADARVREAARAALDLRAERYEPEAR